MAFLLASCGDKSGDYKMTSLPAEAFKGPPDSVLFEDVAQYVAAIGKPAQSTYKHARVDLNGDGLLDGIVLFRLPHKSWCGWDGCGMAIFMAGQENFTPQAAMTGVRGPVYVLTQQHNGMRDIVIRVTGTKMRDKNVLMMFDGRTYPSHPMMAPTYNVPISRVQKQTLFR